MLNYRNYVKYETFLSFASRVTRHLTLWARVHPISEIVRISTAKVLYFDVLCWLAWNRIFSIIIVNNSWCFCVYIGDILNLAFSSCWLSISRHRFPLSWDLIIANTPINLYFISLVDKANMLAFNTEGSVLFWKWRKCITRDVVMNRCDFSLIRN